MRVPRFDIFFLNKLVLAAFDMLALALAYWLSMTLRMNYLRQFGPIYEPTVRHVFLLGVLALLFLFFFRNHHLYRDVAFRRSTEHLVLMTRCWLLFVGIFIAIAFFFKIHLFIEHRVTVALLIIFGWCFLYAGRFLLASRIIRILTQRTKNQNRILVIGPPSDAAGVTQHVSDNRDASHVVEGYIALHDEPSQAHSVPVPSLGTLASLDDILASRGIGEIFISGLDADWRLVYQVIEKARRSGAVVRVALPHFGAIKERAPNLTEIDGGYVYLNNSHLLGFELAAKRLIDLSLSLSAVVVFAPLFALIALAIKLDSRGPVMFRQARVGLGGNIFTVLKFRTMRQNTEEHHKEAIRHLVNGDHEHLTAQSGRGNVLKATKDSEVTAVGRLLRRTSLDELPQLINVLAGDMSLVGPRPLPKYEVDLFASWQHLRHTIKPGITGFWQAYARSAVSHRDMVLMDIFYAVNWSLSLDFRILLRTFFALLSGRGAV